MYNSNYKTARSPEVSRQRVENEVAQPEIKTEKEQTIEPVTENIAKTEECEQAEEVKTEKSSVRRYKLRTRRRTVENICSEAEGKNEEKSLPCRQNHHACAPFCYSDELIMIALAIFLLSEGCDEFLLLAICLVLS